VPQPAHNGSRRSSPTPPRTEQQLTRWIPRRARRNFAGSTLILHSWEWG